MGLLDSIALWVSPSWAAKRAQARADLARAELVTDKLARGFQAVSKGRRAGDWVAVGDSGPTESTDDLATLRNRSREMRRNNPYWNAAINTITSNTVGHGIRATATARSKALQAKVQTEFDNWARTKRCDAAGKSDFYALQSLAMSTVVNSGEILVRKVIASDRTLRLQLLPAEFLASEADTRGVDVGNTIIGGVEHDSFGAPVAYHLYRQHPSVASFSRDVVRVPADQIAHVFRVEVPGQMRGIPWVAPVFTRLQDWEDFADAELMRQKIAACFGVVYKGVSPDDDDELTLRDRLEPGMVEHLPSGTDMMTISPPANQSLEAMARVTHRAVAAGLGITYEALTSDYSNVNFSSARMANLQMARNVRSWQQDILIELFLDRVWSWFTETLELQGLSGARATTVSWSVPAPQLVDPEKETKAIVARVRSGLISLSAAIREQGLAPEEVLTQIAADNRLLDQLGIVLDSDPRKVSAQGQGSVNQKDESADVAA